jgi:hypothetical protein
LRPKFDTRNGKINVVCADLNLLDLFVRHLEYVDPFQVQRHPSGAQPSLYTAPHSVLTEDDMYVGGAGGAHFVV